MPSDITHLLRVGLRAQDLDELDALDRKPGAALLDGLVKGGALCFTVHVDDEPAGMFGAVASDVVDVGVVWMLGTDLMLAARRELLREAPRWIDFLQIVYPTLTNYVDERNTVSIAWLKRMGFQFDGDGVAVGDDNLFRRFYRCANP